MVKLYAEAEYDYLVSGMAVDIDPARDADNHHPDYLFTGWISNL